MVLISVLLIGLLSGVSALAATGGVGLLIFQPISAIMARMKSIDGHSFLRNLYDTIIAAIGFYYLVYFMRTIILDPKMHTISDLIPWVFASSLLIVPWFVRHHSNGHLLYQTPMLIFFSICLVINAIAVMYTPMAYCVQNYGIVSITITGAVLPLFYLSLEWKEFDKISRLIEYSKNDTTLNK